jgi:hypothetical protein
MRSDRSSIEPWPTSRCVGIRALLIYVVLYTFPFPLSLTPIVGELLSGLWFTGLGLVANFVAHTFLGIEDELFTGPTGSGDTTVAYVLLLFNVVLTLIGTAVWSLVDRKPRAYAKAARWLEIFCRFWLGSTLLVYGLQKLVPLQMPTPGLDRLVTPIGDISPMGLVWFFMGFSPLYQSLAGAAETLGGLLLFWRRTRLLGAMISSVVLTNVVMLNYLYDVPVKLYSSHLLLTAIGLVLLDARRLLAVFVLNQPVPSEQREPLLTTRRARRSGEALRIAFVLWVIAQNAWMLLQYYPIYGSGRPRHELWGIHDVESFVSEGQELPPLLTDELRWKALIIDHALPFVIEGEPSPGYVHVQGMNGELTLYRVEFDDEQSSMKLSRPEQPGVGGQLSYSRPNAGHLVLTGEWGGSPVEIHLYERDLGSMALTGRGFQWISEYPYHR